MEAEAQRGERYSRPREQTAYGKGHTFKKVGHGYRQWGGVPERCGEVTSSDLFLGERQQSVLSKESECEEQEASDKKHAVILTQNKTPLQFSATVWS